MTALKQFTCIQCQRLFTVTGNGPEPYPEEVKLNVQCPRAGCLTPQNIDWPNGYTHAVNPKEP